MGHDAGFGDAVLLTDCILDFDRRDKNAAALEAVVRPTGDPQVTVLVGECEVPGVIPPVMHDFGGLVRILVIAQEESRIVGGDQEVTDLSSRDRIVIVIQNLDARARQGLPTEPGRTGQCGL